MQSCAWCLSLRRTCVRSARCVPRGGSAFQTQATRGVQHAFPHPTHARHERNHRCTSVRWLTTPHCEQMRRHHSHKSWIEHWALCTRMHNTAPCYPAVRLTLQYTCFPLRRRLYDPPCSTPASLYVGGRHASLPLRCPAPRHHCRPLTLTQ